MSRDQQCAMKYGNAIPLILVPLAASIAVLPGCSSPHGFMTGAQMQIALALQLPAEVARQAPRDFLYDSTIQCPGVEYHDGVAGSCTAQASTPTGPVDVNVAVTPHYAGTDNISNSTWTIRFDLTGLA
jgi:hypothetical protein